jgi:flagellar protein FliS
MLYKGAIHYLEQAKIGIKEDRVSLSQEGFERARKIILHLYSTLDLEKGGQIAQRLQSLYAYMIEKILTANATKNENLTNEVISLLSTIKEGWEKIDLKDQAIDEEMKKTAPSNSPLISVKG